MKNAFQWNVQFAVAEFRVRAPDKLGIAEARIVVEARAFEELHKWSQRHRSFPLQRQLADAAQVPAIPRVDIEALGPLERDVDIEVIDEGDIAVGVPFRDQRAVGRSASEIRAVVAEIPNVGCTQLRNLILDLDLEVIDRELEVWTNDGCRSRQP